MDFFSYRVIEMPYAYQCCVYGSCDSYKPASQWDAEQSNTDEDLHKRTVAMYPIHADAHCKKTQKYNICATHNVSCIYCVNMHMQKMVSQNLIRANLIERTGPEVLGLWFLILIMLYSR